MNRWLTHALFTSTLILIALTVGAQVPSSGTAADRQAILQAERDWTQSFVTSDVAVNSRIVADDFFGTEPDGRRINKVQLLAEVKSDPPLVSNHLNEDDLTIRFYGDTAVANGSESWKQKDGKTGRWIWTDVFVKRNGKWQVVASQDLEVSDKK